MSTQDGNLMACSAPHRACVRAFVRACVRACVALSVRMRAYAIVVAAVEVVEAVCMRMYTRMPVPVIASVPVSVCMPVCVCVHVCACKYASGCGVIFEYPDLDEICCQWLHEPGVPSSVET